MDMKVCRDCGKEFDVDAKRTICKAGYINQCAQCSLKSGDNDIRCIGKQGLTNKDGSITIFRENLDFVRRVIKAENAAGFNANLTLSSPVVECERQGKNE